MATSLKRPLNGIDKYVEILRNHLIPNIENDMKFMQDNCPCHKARSVKYFFEESSIEILPWPPYSPDINPIENLWAILKQRVHSTPTKTRQEMVSKIQRIWQNDDNMLEICANLIESMPRRIESLIAAKGGYIKY